MTIIINNENGWHRLNRCLLHTLFKYWLTMNSYIDQLCQHKSVISYLDWSIIHYIISSQCPSWFLFTFIILMSWDTLVACTHFNKKSFAYKKKYLCQQGHCEIPSTDENQQAEQLTQVLNTSISWVKYP